MYTKSELERVQQKETIQINLHNHVLNIANRAHTFHEMIENAGVRSFYLSSTDNSLRVELTPSELATALVELIKITEDELALYYDHDKAK